MKSALILCQSRGVHFPDLFNFRDRLNSSVVLCPRVDPSLPRRILNVLIQHPVIDKVRRTGRPRVDFQLHQSGGNVIGKSLVARSVSFSLHQRHTRPDTHVERLDPGGACFMSSPALNRLWRSSPPFVSRSSRGRKSASEGLIEGYVGSGGERSS